MSPAEAPRPGRRQRIAVCTDLTSRHAGTREPDDAQSLVRLLLHLDGVDLEAILPGSGLEHGHTVHGEAIAHELIDAYAQVQDRLRRHDAGYPLVESLRALVHPGQAVADRAIAVERSVGRGLDTPASRHLVRLIDRADDRPLHICLWGGAADLAQALWWIRQERGPEGIAAASARIRVHAIGDQDSAAAWAKGGFPTVPWITRRWSYRGMYRGGDTGLVDAAWVEREIRPHGPLCALYPSYRGGDIWHQALGPVHGVKEGDTPSWLGLIANGLHYPEHHGWGGWGGRLRPEAPHRWTCEGVCDRLAGDGADMRPEMSGVYRWRPAVQAAFALRARRCVLPPGRVPVEPAMRIGGPLTRPVAPGERVTLSAAGSLHPGGAALRHVWWIYGPAGTATRLPAMAGTDQEACVLTIPDDGIDGEVHVILEGHGEADPAVRGYARTVLIPAP